MRSTHRSRPAAHLRETERDILRPRVRLLRRRGPEAAGASRRPSLVSALPNNLANGKGNVRPLRKKRESPRTVTSQLRKSSFHSRSLSVFSCFPCSARSFTGLCATRPLCRTSPRSPSAPDASGRSPFARRGGPQARMPPPSSRCR